MTANTAAAAVSPTEEMEEISVSNFYQTISQKNDILLLDVRNDQDFDTIRQNECFKKLTV